MHFELINMASPQTLPVFRINWFLVQIWGKKLLDFVGWKKCLDPRKFVLLKDIDTEDNLRAKMKCRIEIDGADKCICVSGSEYRRSLFVYKILQMRASFDL